MKSTLILPVAIILLLLSSCLSRRSEALVGNSMSITDSQVRNGQIQFNKFCQKCHPGGEAGLGPALNSNPAPGFIKKFQVRHGLGVMPSFKKDEISSKDLDDIIHYLKALKHFR